MGNKKSSLKQKLILSHVMISLVFLAVLIVSIINLAYTQRRFSQQFNEVIPLLETNAELKSGIQKSLVLLRDWVNTQDNDQKKERAAIWKNVIFPAIDSLESFQKNTHYITKKNTIEKIDTLMQRVFFWEWIIEDAAHTKGNRPMTLQIDRVLYPLLQNILQQLPEVMLSDSDLAFAKRALRDSILNAMYYAQTQKSERYQDSLSQLKKMEQRGYFNSDGSLLVAFTSYVTQFIHLNNIAKKQKNNLANQLMNTKLLPLTEQTFNVLDVFSLELKGSIEKKQASLVNQTDLFFYILSLIIVVSIAFTIGLAIWRSNHILEPISSLTQASKELEKGNYDTPLPVNQTDEIGELASAFDHMRRIRIQTEKTLNNTLKKLKHNNETLSSFTYVASHDLKTPLHGIRLLTGNILEDCKGKLSEQSISDINRIQERVDRLNDLVNALMQLASTASETKTIKTINTKNLIKSLTQSDPAYANFQFIFHGQFPEFETDAERLKLVFEEIIDNSVSHHTSDTGTIEFFIEDEDPFYVFRIQDDGPGVDEAYRSKVFDLFQKVSAKKTQGVGIGLPTVKKMVERYDGWIRIEPSVKIGTQIAFAWPKVIHLSPDK